MEYGYSEHEVKKIIQHELDRNPDLKYYINNPYFDEFVSLLLDGISIAIVKNGEEVIKDIEREMRMRRRI